MLVGNLQINIDVDTKDESDSIADRLSVRRVPMIVTNSTVRVRG